MSKNYLNYLLFKTNASFFYVQKLAIFVVDINDNHDYHTRSPYQKGDD